RAISLPDCSREGYTFAGWVDESGRVMTQVAAGTFGDLHLTAVWYKQAQASDGESKEIITAAKDGEDDVTLVVNEEILSDIESVSAEFNNGGKITFPASLLSGSQSVTMKAVDVKELPVQTQELVGNGAVFSLSTTLGSSFGEAYVTVSLPFALAEDQNDKAVKVYWLKDDGTVQEIDATYEDGCAVFQTNHFSYWFVKAIDAPGSSGGSSGGMCGSTIAAIVMSMCMIAAVPVIRYVRP
ncbi:MAG: hypothetical protein MJZ21_03265, partial [archaeon]|nr:hypothetical protein [archaeon]